MGTETKAEKKQIIFSGMQPTGVLTLGNYIGALKNWIHLQDNYHSLFCIVDLHSITLRQDPAVLRKRSRELLMQYIAAGLDPEKNIIFYQSHVPAHSELAWILNCYTYMGELNRMTQFKEKSEKNEANINAGLFTYPVLMAADILLYQADLVPVGDDQKQHLEITRDIAQRFNNIYGEVFTVPEPYIPKVGARIMSLQEPMKKMSKSDDNENAYIGILDEPNRIRNKVKRAVTDSLGVISYNDDQPGVKNLLNIYCSLRGETVESALSHFEGKGYGDLKKEVGEAIVDELTPLQDRFKELEKNKDYIDQIIKTNGEKANQLAQRTLQKVQRKVGFPSRI
ncbi:MAG: tryptophan--tRNA ligase [Epulopiscium sp.]|nr:tryptophan--tRNA ligase [Candidatus Epulonipiscium sp.]